MKLFRPYSNIKDFLEKFTLLKIGSLHLRIHKITSNNNTPFYHNHPFNYISIILKGRYSEKYFSTPNSIKERTSSLGSIIFGNHTTYHKIESVKTPTYSFFIAYGKYNWNALNLDKPKHKKGIYQRTLNNSKIWAKRENDIWFIGHSSKEKAKQETRHSIHQVL